MLLFHQILDRNRSPDHYIRFNLYPKGNKIRYLIIHHLILRKSEFRNSIPQHTSRGMKNFKYCNFISGFCKIGGTRKPRGTTAHNCHFHPIGLGLLAKDNISLSAIVRHKTLKLSYCHRLPLKT